MRRTEQFTFFYTEHDCFSNWFIAPFVYKGITFNCVEQFMMYGKAKLFGDEAIAARILLEQRPGRQKALGKMVSGFDKAVWDEKCMPIVYVGAREKFTQHPFLLRQLLACEGTQLVEASPSDTIWGIGLGQNAHGVEDPKNWRGENRLGRVLTRLCIDQIKLRDNSPAAPVAPAPYQGKRPKLL